MDPDSLGAELYEFLLDANYAVPPEVRQGCEWRMHPEWASEVRKLTTSSGYPVWEGEWLFGFPVSIRPEFGVPELAPPVR